MNEAVTEVRNEPRLGFWKERWWEVLGAVGSWLFVASPLVTGKILLGFDTFAYASPNLEVTRLAWRDLRVPQWNSFTFGGVPHLANAQSSLFNPLKLPFLGFEADHAVMLITAAHLLVLAVGLVVLARRLGLRPPAGLAMVVVVIGSGMVAGKSIQFEQVLVVAYIPWFLAAIDLVLDRPARPRRAVGWLALSTALLVVAGHPQIEFMALALGVTWALSRALVHRTPSSLGYAAAGVCLGGVAALAQLLPTVLFLDGAAALDRGATYIGNPAALLQRKLVPTALLGDVTSRSTPALSGVFEAMTYVGVVAVVLGLCGVVTTLSQRRSRWGTIVLLSTAAGALVLTFGTQTPIYGPLADVVPFMSQIRVPARWVVVIVFVIAVFVGQGVDALLQRIERDALIWVGALLAASAIVIAAGPFSVPAGARPGLWVLLALAALGLIVLIGRVPSARRPVVVGAVIMLGALELGAMALNGPLRLLPRVDAIADLEGRVGARARRSPGRTFSSVPTNFGDPRSGIESLRPNANQLFEVPTIDGYDGGPAVRARWIDAMSAFTDGAFATDLPLWAQVRTPLSPALFARFGVGQVIVDTDYMAAQRQVPGWRDSGVADGSTDQLRLFENPEYDGDGFVYFATRRVPDHVGATLRRLSVASLRRVALVGPDGPHLRCDEPCDREPAPVRRPSPERIEMTTRSASRGLATVPEQADDGWRVTVDGRDADLVRVDGFALGVAVPAGRHEVVFTYRTPGLVPGLALSTLGLVAIGVLLADPRRRSRAEGGSDADQVRSVRRYS